MRPRGSTRETSRRVASPTPRYRDPTQSRPDPSRCDRSARPPNEGPHPTTTRCPSRVAPQPTCLRSVARTARKPPRPAHESDTHGHARRSGCVLLRGSGQPAPPACRSRLRSAGYAVCPSRRSHTQATPSVPRGASHTQPALWARPAGSLTCAGRVGSSLLMCNMKWSE